MKTLAANPPAPPAEGESAPGPTRASCPLCGKAVAVNRDGTLRKHVVAKAESDLRGEVCNGSGITSPTARPDPLAGRAWQPVDEFMAAGASGTRSYPMRVGDKCKVAGTGRGGAAGSGWRVTAIERNTDTGEVNVAVLRGRDSRERIVRSTRIVYQRQTTRRRP